MKLMALDVMYSQQDIKGVY